MNNKLEKAVEQAKKKLAKPGVSFSLAGGEMAELVYKPGSKATAFAVFKNGESHETTELTVNKRRYVPYSANNNLIANDVVLLPSGIEDYGSERDLLSEIHSYIHRYVDISADFEQVAGYYVLFSWLYDAFNELPYLRARGDYGSGKTRFLLTVGSICYKPIFASGASTVSPLFRILDSFRGTLIIDEGDFRWSDERAELTKILNNGNARGFPVLRSETVGNSREFNPRAYAVYGPKLVASRGVFEDKALESRFLTEEMGVQKLRTDVPINLPAQQRDEAQSLRNKLLLFRFRNRNKARILPELADINLEPRLNQIFVPLLSTIENEEDRETLRQMAKAYNRELTLERGMAIEGQVVAVIHDLASNGESRLSIKEIMEAFVARHADDYDRKITPKWIGSVVRHRLHLKTYKTNGVYVIAPEEHPKLELLYAKYGLATDEAGTTGRTGT